MIASNNSEPSLAGHNKTATKPTMSTNILFAILLYVTGKNFVPQNVQKVAVYGQNNDKKSLTLFGSRSGVVAALPPAPLPFVGLLCDIS